MITTPPLSIERITPAPMLEFQTDEGTCLIDPDCIRAASLNRYGSLIIQYEVGGKPMVEVVTHDVEAAIDSIRRARSAPPFLVKEAAP